MMKSLVYISFFLLALNGMDVGLKTQHKNSTYLAGNELIEYHGRIEKISDHHVALIGSASSATMAFKGENCELMLKSGTDRHNYINVELDGKYLGRFRIENKTKPFKIVTESIAEIHSVSVYKATEAASGSIVFEGINAEELVPHRNVSKKTIEFIGNSITCGAMSDASQIPCDEGEYLDHHNAYLAYGPQIAKALNTNFILSSVSGIGMYRNWNDENDLEPIMPDVYENLYLNDDKSKPYITDTDPDIISICLGTNDMSEGDGTKDRLPFNPQKFTTNYIGFVNMIAHRYPEAKFLLINSPMIQGEKNEVLLGCLKNIRAHFKDKQIQLFEFDELYVNGCGYHPSTEEHKKMAHKLTPVFKELLKD